MIFFEDDSSFSLHTTHLKSSSELTSGLWLTLAGVNETPPHIALISEGKYYSLSARKVECGSPAERFINTLKRRQIPVLFIRIQIKNNPVSSLEKAYKNLQPLSSTENTCLTPIKAFFAEYYSNPFATVSYVFELLAMAQKQNMIQECVSLFCEDANSNIVTLPKYNMIQIKNNILALSSPNTSIK